MVCSAAPDSDAWKFCRHAWIEEKQRRDDERGRRERCEKLPNDSNRLYASATPRPMNRLVGASHGHMRTSFRRNHGITMAADRSVSAMP